MAKKAESLNRLHTFAVVFNDFSSIFFIVNFLILAALESATPQSTICSVHIRLSLEIRTLVHDIEEVIVIIRIAVKNKNTHIVWTPNRSSFHSESKLSTRRNCSCFDRNIQHRNASRKRTILLSNDSTTVGSYIVIEWKICSNVMCRWRLKYFIVPRLTESSQQSNWQRFKYECVPIMMISAFFSTCKIHTRRSRVVMWVWYCENKMPYHKN